MPGIVGVVSQKSAHEAADLVEAMLGCMKHEPFYASEAYAAPELGISAGWMAHPNSFAARTFYNEERGIALLLSGECFNGSEMRPQLLAKGHDLGENEGNWLVHSYEEKGESFVEHLNGLFSGLLIDKRKGRAFLFNDRFGSERIYWHQADDGIYFASEAKALLRVLPGTRSFEPDGVAQFLTYGCTFEGRTLFKGVDLLPAASVCSFQNGDCSRRKYFSPEQWEEQTTLSKDAFASEFQDTFERIIPRYFQFKGKIGISLTGGLDTRMIMACQPPTVLKPVCYTFTGETGRTFDDRIAARVAQACGLEHHLLRIGPDFFSDFRSHVDQTVYISDGTSGPTGAHEIYLNKKARQLSPLRLTGNFGSEVLRGVSTFKPIGLSGDLLSPELSETVKRSAPLPKKENHPVTFAAFREIPWNLSGSVSAARSQVTFRTPYLDNEIVALAYRAPKSLWKSPETALRLIQRRSRTLSGIATDRGHRLGERGLGHLVRRSLAEATFKLDYLYTEGLPGQLTPFDPILGSLARLGVIGLHKYLPYRRWFRKPLADPLTQILTDRETARMQFWNEKFLHRIAADHVGGRRNYLPEINAVLTLEAVERLFFRGFTLAQNESNYRGAIQLSTEPVAAG